MTVSADIVSATKPLRRTGGRPAPLVLAALVIAVLAFGSAILSPLIVPGATNQNLALSATGPSLHHLLGTDQLGRDVLALVCAGARTSVFGALAIAVGSMLIGNILGLVAGYYGGWVDSLVMRWADLMFSLPALLVAIVVTGIAGGSFVVAVAVLVVLFSPGDTRTVRGAVLDQRHRPYVEAARLLDLRASRVMTRHLWPNIAPVALANGFLDFAFGLVSLASLSFLGLGISPGSADWGRTLADNKEHLFTSPWSVVAPGLAIILTAAAVNIVGDWVYERLEARGLER